MTKAEWRRFEVITEDDKQVAQLEALLESKQITRRELALILFSLRVRSGFRPADFDI